MQHLLYLEVLSCLPEEGFPLDELVMKTQQLFAQEGMAGFVGLLLSLLDERLSLSLLGKIDGWRPVPCCAHPRYESKGRRPRRFRTGIGEVKVEWRQMVCRNCGRHLIPLREFLRLSPYQSKSQELERTVVEVVSEQSYRRSSSHLQTIGKIPVPKSTSHRWVAQSDCDESEWPPDLRYILADGTSYRRRPNRSKQQDHHGEVRVVLGVDDRGDLLGLGAYSGWSWTEIREDLDRLRGGHGKARLLISDGEPGLADNLAGLADDYQRCHWHALRDVGYSLWRDGLLKPVRDPERRRLKGILEIQLPSGSVESVAKKDRRGILSRMKQAEQGLDKMIADFERRGYRAAAGYVRSAQRHLFGHLRLWLRTGLIAPRTSSLIERWMREIGRRLKRIAFGWSEEGAAKMTRIIIKHLASKEEWERWWQRKMGIEGKVMLVYRGVHVK